MIALFGNITLGLALIAAIIQSLFPCIGFYRHKPHLLAIAKPAALLQCMTIFLSYSALTFAFLTNDFSLTYVAENSEASLPLAYRFTAVWSGHEGSLLLWVVCLNLWTLFYLYLQKISKERQLTLVILGWINSLFILFLFIFANPFIINTHQHVGQDLNPLLQDPGLFIHPPLLTLGYVGFALIFAVTFAALLTNTLNSRYLNTIKTYLIITWCILTLGILLGSFWAYRVLGWGGFWFWDPIENLSLLPWFTGLALIHLLKFAEKNKIYGWIAGLSLLGFSFSLLGTFLARSGLLVSVHSFAAHGLQSIVLLCIISFIFFAALLVLTLKLPASSPWKRLHQGELFLLSAAGLSCLVVFILFIGITYPLFRHSLHLPSMIMNARFYHHTLGPLALLAFIGIVLTPSLKPAMLLAHLGFIILLLGLLLPTVFTQTHTFQIKPGQAVHLGPYQFFFLEVTETKTLHSHDIQAHFEVLKSGHPITSLISEKRIFLTRDTIVTKPAVDPGLFRDIYLVLGEPLDKDFWSVRITYKPFIRFIILGSTFMMIGGILSLLQRKRYL